MNPREKTPPSPDPRRDPIGEDALSRAWANRFDSRGASLGRCEPEDEPAPTAEAATTKAQPSEPPARGSYRPRAHSGVTFRGNLVVKRGPVVSTEAPLPIPALTVLALVDGQSTVRQIVDASGLEDDLAHGAIEDLVSRDMIRCLDR